MQKIKKIKMIFLLVLLGRNYIGFIISCSQSLPYLHTINCESF